MIAAGADANIAKKDGTSPLIEAIKKRYLNVITWLLHAGADVNATKLDGETPLHEACRRGLTSVVMQLLAFGGNVNAATSSYKQLQAGGVTPLFVATENNLPEIANMLVSAGADMTVECYNISDLSTTSPLHAAVHLDRRKILGRFICAGVDVNTVFSTGELPLHVAARMGHRGIAE